MVDEIFVCLFVCLFVGLYIISSFLFGCLVASNVMLILNIFIYNIYIYMFFIYFLVCVC